MAKGAKASKVVWLSMDDKTRPDFSADEEATLRDLAELAMAEIERRRLTGAS
jgi:GAF domain-containing protein